VTSSCTGGFRHDQLLHVLQEFSVPSGSHRVRISFTRRERTDVDTATFTPVVSPDADTGLYASRAQREAAEYARRAALSFLPRLALDTALALAPQRWRWSPSIPSASCSSCAPRLVP
jgi:hypothetical protein